MRFCLSCSCLAQFFDPVRRRNRLGLPLTYSKLSSSATLHFPLSTHKTRRPIGERVSWEHKVTRTQVHPCLEPDPALCGIGAPLVLVASSSPQDHSETHHVDRREFSSYICTCECEGAVVFCEPFALGRWLYKRTSSSPSRWRCGVGIKCCEEGEGEENYGPE